VSGDGFGATRIAGPREAGAKCPACGVPVADGEAIAVCPACGGAHHRSCWDRDGRCASYECAPARRDLAGATPAVRISTNDLAAAVPLAALPVARVTTFVRPPLPIPRRSRLAIAAFVVAVAGVPLFGLVTGPIAVILACIALGGLTARRQKGLAFALVAVFLGLLDFGGWAALMYYAFHVREPATVMLADFRPDPAAFEGLDPPLNRAMRANVLIHVRSGWINQGLGSGVIFRIRDGQAWVLTNRHVADPDFSAKPGADADALTVQLVGQPAAPGHLAWVAPDGVDLAVVTVACNTKDAMIARWRPGRSVKIGDATFAVGNPHGLGWTHTTGVVSQFRVHEYGGRSVRVIQTQTNVQPGNSGGGLYAAADGTLVGIVTWAQDPRSGEGLNFAISVEALADLLPADLQPEPAPR
jgi:S1-C subfamily serine protease